LIQSRVKTPLSERAGMPTGKTHRIGGWSLSDSVASRAKPAIKHRAIKWPELSHV